MAKMTNKAKEKAMRNNFSAKEMRRLNKQAGFVNDIAKK